MSRSDCLIALFGRPVWLRCKLCQRVNPAMTEEFFPSVLDGGACGDGTAPRQSLQIYGGFQTVCEHCQRPGRSRISGR